jgi:hypothetical protein
MQDSPAVFDILLCGKLTAAVKQLRDSNGFYLIAPVLESCSGKPFGMPFNP